MGRSRTDRDRRRRRRGWEVLGGLRAEPWYGSKRHHTGGAMEYVSPIDERVRQPEPLAQRTAGIEGKTVALLDISKNRGAEFLDRLELHFHERGAKPIRFRKPTFSRPAPAELIEEIALHGDLAVEGLAD